MIHAYCSICQESFNNKSEISALQCGHIFHTCCILQWLKTKTSCPNCRCLGANNFIKKIFFDQVSEENNSFVEQRSSSEDNDKKLSDLRSDIARLKMQLHEIEDVNKDLALKNQTLTDNLNTINKTNHLNDMDICRTLDEKDEAISRYEKKIHSLRFINDIINKSQDKINDKISKLRSSPDILEQLENICSSVVILKTDRDFYKDKAESLTKELSRSDMKTRILEAKLESSHTNSDNIDEDLFKSPLRPRSDSSGRRGLSTPQRLAMSSPDTPASIQKKRIHEETVSSNPFSRNPVGKRSKCVLGSLSIMQKKPALWQKRSL